MVSKQNDGKEAPSDSLGCIGLKLGVGWNDGNDCIPPPMLPKFPLGIPVGCDMIPCGWKPVGCESIDGAAPGKPVCWAIICGC